MKKQALLIPSMIHKFMNQKKLAANKTIIAAEMVVTWTLHLLRIILARKSLSISLSKILKTISKLTPVNVTQAIITQFTPILAAIRRHLRSKNTKCFNSSTRTTNPCHQTMILQDTLPLLILHKVIKETIIIRNIFYF